ncbi:MAG TPA: hypothetical protein VJ385_07465 [Fibrobacteria bacterium]|nr:hypothetical protein [Fibrobacteria bacterium]
MHIHLPFRSGRGPLACGLHHARREIKITFSPAHVRDADHVPGIKKTDREKGWVSAVSESRQFHFNPLSPARFPETCPEEGGAALGPL